MTSARRGVAAETVAEAVSTVAPAARLRRLVGMLARKGFDHGLAMRVVRDVLADGVHQA